MSKQGKKINKGGRPKEKVSEKVDLRQVTILAEKGFTDVEMGNFFGVTEMTINNWKKDPEFLLALKAGKSISDDKVEKALFNRAIGYEHKADKIFQYEGSPVVVPYTERYPPDPTSMIFWLKNRQPGRWRDKQEVEHSGEVKTIQQTHFSIKPIGKK